MADRTPPNRKLSLGTMSKNIVFWVLIVLLSIAFYQMVNASRQQSVEIRYSTFSRELDRDNVAQVEITNGQFIQGELKQAISADGRQVKQLRLVAGAELRGPGAAPRDEERPDRRARAEAVHRSGAAAAAAVDDSHRSLALLLPPGPAGRQPRVRVRQVQSQAAHRGYPQGHLRRRGGGGRGQGRAAGNHRVFEGSAEVPATGRAVAQGGAAG